MTCSELYCHVVAIHNGLNSKQREENFALRKAEVYACDFLTAYSLPGKRRHHGPGPAQPLDVFWRT